MSLIRAMASTTLAVALGASSPSNRDPMRSYVVEPDASTLYVVTHRAGLLSFLGHEHAIVPLDWSARLCLADPIAVGSWGSVSIDAASLVIDSDSARALAGLGGGPGADDRREIQSRMLDSDHLDADSFPEIRLRLSVAETPDSEQIVTVGSLNLHGVERNVRVPVHVERVSEDHIRLGGNLRVRQRDYGIEPESRAGVVKVSNDVDLHFSISAAATETPCDANAP